MGKSIWCISSLLGNFCDGATVAIRFRHSADVERTLSPIEQGSTERRNRFFFFGCFFFSFCVLLSLLFYIFLLICFFFFFVGWDEGSCGEGARACHAGEEGRNGSLPRRGSERRCRTPNVVRSADQSRKGSYSPDMGKPCLSFLFLGCWDYFGGWSELLQRVRLPRKGAARADSNGKRKCPRRSTNAAIHTLTRWRHHDLIALIVLTFP